MITSKEKSVQLKSLNDGTELLVKEFYDLRKVFENEYSGKLRSHKYEETREFTIALNHAIFQANQLNLHEIGFSQKTVELESILQTLKKDLGGLKL